MKTTSLVSVAVLAGVFGLATAGWGGSEEISAQRGSAMAQLEFGVSVTTNKAIYATGERIVIQLIVFNRTPEKLTFHFKDAQRYDFIIEDGEGKKLWHWAEGQMFAQVLGEETAGPGREEMVYTETYAGPLEPGDYKVIGILVAQDRPLSASVTIRIG